MSMYTVFKSVRSKSIFINYTVDSDKCILTNTTSTRGCTQG